VIGELRALCRIDLPAPVQSAASSGLSLSLSFRLLMVGSSASNGRVGLWRLPRGSGGIAVQPVFPTPGAEAEGQVRRGGGQAAARSSTGTGGVAGAVTNGADEPSAAA